MIPEFPARSRFAAFVISTCVLLHFVAVQISPGFAQTANEEKLVCTSSPSWLTQLLRTPKATRTVRLSGGKVERVLVIRQSDSLRPRFGLELVAVKLPSGSYHFKVEDVRSTGDPYAIFHSHDDPRGDLVVVNGGFSVAAGQMMRPIGLMVSNGKVRTRFPS